MARPTRIAFLTSHLQPFLIAGMDALLQKGGVSILLVCWPSPDAAPCSVSPTDQLQVVEKTGANRHVVGQQILAFNPDIIYGPGWMDRDYLRWIRACRKKGAASIMGMDNQWKGSLKQQLLCLLSPWTLRKIYSKIFVPGTRQINYAQRLGFNNHEILTGLYTPDTALFHTFFQESIGQKRSHYPRQFLYLGRLVGHKAQLLFQAFGALTAMERNGWTLLAVGNGPLKDAPYFNIPGITHIPYADQDQLGDVFASCGIGCLTSSDEPWGTVIQEMAAGGLPIIASHQCGAATDFVMRNFNGTICDGDSLESIRESLLFMIHQSDERLLEMGENSARLGVKTNPDTWANTVLSALT